MEVFRFTDEYSAVAPLYGTSPGELRARDARRDPPGERWIVVGRGEPVGAVTSLLRPDDRVFLSFVGARATIGPLTDAAHRSLGRAVYTFVDADDRDDLEAFEAAGFVTELVEERFRIGFDRALAMLKRAWVPTGISLRPAHTVDEDRLFELDNALRHLTPGTDGWRGNRAWFRGELAESPPFDPAAYLVAVAAATDEYVGLVRIWRNPTGPRFGLVGVLPPYRSQPIAASLMKQALSAAADWGHGSFVAETSPANPVICHRMARLGAESLGRFLQLVRR